MGVNMIQFRIKELMAERERRTGDRVTYALIHQDTGIWPRSLSALATNKAKKVGVKTISELCRYFECQPGELLVYIPDDA